MSELFGLVDVGGTQNRVAVVDEEMRPIGIHFTPTVPHDYEGTVLGIGDTLVDLSAGKGELVAASIAVAAEVDADGVLTRAGGLKSWIGRRLGEDTAKATGLAPELVGSMGDMEAAALSQQEINRLNRRKANGVALTLSSGWGGAKYHKEGGTESDEPGHEYLRDGGVCPCGERDHAEAFISGNGAIENHGVRMENLLEQPDAADQFVTDVSTAVVNMIERHRNEGFDAEELRWTGSVALGQPLLMRRAYEGVRYHLGSSTPAWENLGMGDLAGLHGTFIDAQRLARAA